jgi:hypothetical protein
MNKKMDWMPPVRHKRSQNAGVVYTLADDVMAVVDSLIRISFRPEGDMKPRRRLVKSEAIRRYFWLEDWEKQAIIGSTPRSAERAGGQPRSVQAESRTASSEC